TDRRGGTSFHALSVSIALPRKERQAICPVLRRTTHQLDAVPNQSGETAMNKFNILVVAGALLTVPMSSATAGPCTTEIENITKLMAARDAGAGPTTGAGGAADQQPAERRAEHPPTEAMSRQLQGGAASPQDVQTQTRGGPTAAEQAQGARQPVAAEAIA